MVSKTRQKQLHKDDRRNSTASQQEDGAPPFVPLEETVGSGPPPSGSLLTPKSLRSKSSDTTRLGAKKKKASPGGGSSSPTTAEIQTKVLGFVRRTVQNLSRTKLSMKKVISLAMMSVIFLVLWDALFTAPEKRLIQPDFADTLLQWVQLHPTRGLVAILVVIAAAVVVMIPIGTPITVGCGYIYKAAYGWKLGLFVATAVSMGGSALGAVTCFLLGRYLMRDQVRLWVRKYPIFDAIDVAASEHGFRIMAMLYLTPILPLGPTSYMCGTTSMALSSFVLAKIASLPLMFFYVFIGASTGALIGSSGGKDEMKSIEENETLIVAGILMSFVMIAGITHYIRKELNTILERQEKHKPGEMDEQPVGSSEAGVIGDAGETSESTLEMGMTAPRQRKQV